MHQQVGPNHVLVINTKERQLALVFSLEAEQQAVVMTAPKALHTLLEDLTRLEYTVLGVFGTSTPIGTVHRLLAEGPTTPAFDVQDFFSASTAAIDFLLTFAKALAASALAST